MRRNPPTPCRAWALNSISIIFINIFSVATKYFAGVMMLFANIQGKQAK